MYTPRSQTFLPNSSLYAKFDMKIVDVYIIPQTSLPNIVRSPYKDKLKPQTVSLDMAALGSREQDSFISELDPVIENDEIVVDSEY